MKRNTASASFTPLVVTEFGTGWFCPNTRELRQNFGVHVSPAPLSVRPATEAEAREFFEVRAHTRRELTAYYARSTYTGD